MNMLTWFLYFAEVAGNITGLLSFVSIAYFAFGAMFYLVMSFGAGMENYENRAAPIRDRRDAFLANYLRTRNVVIAIIMAFLATIIPSTKTVYLMAASELGEEAVTSKYAGDLYNKIDRFLEIQLSEMENGNSNQKH